MISLLKKIRKHKLPVSFLFIISIFLSLGIVTINGLGTLGVITARIAEHPLVVSNASLSAALNITKMHRSMKDVVLADSPDERESALNAVAESEQKVYQELDTVRNNILGEEGAALEKQARQLVEDWKTIRKNVVKFLDSGNKQEAILITKTTGADHVIALEAKTLELTLYARNKADVFLKLAEETRLRLEIITIVLLTAATFASLIIAFIVTNLVLNAEQSLREQNDKLHQAFAEIKKLQGIIPICMHCKEIRDDTGSWNKLEKYISEHSEAQFSHGICEKCIEKYYPNIPD